MRTVLALDVGNTQVKAGLYVAGHLAARLQTPTGRLLNAGQYEGQLRDRFSQWQTLDTCLIATVVRDTAEPLTAAVGAIWSVAPVVVTPRSNLAIEINVPHPEGVGIDRLIEASEAFRILGSGAVVGAFGSAITVDLITDAGTFCGGTILPGLRAGVRALHQMTSLLPEIEIETVAGVLGTDTVSCMRAGS
ncbi:MAG: type III pantothenate kinase, partial [bacterium]|nr:type III pantothenate kinase [bacterium]